MPGQRAFENLPPSDPNARPSIYQRHSLDLDQGWTSRGRRIVTKDAEALQGTANVGSPITLASRLYRR